VTKLDEARMRLMAVTHALNFKFGSLATTELLVGVLVGLLLDSRGPQGAKAYLRELAAEVGAEPPAPRATPN
jgi:hypothetical protein